MPDQNLTDDGSLSGELCKLLLEHIGHALVIVGQDMRVLAINSQMEALFGLPAETLLVGQHFHDILREWAQITRQTPQMLEQSINRTQEREPYVFEFQQLIDGESRWCELRHNPMPHGGFIRNFFDISERKRLEHELKRQAGTDFLTQLCNRRSFVDHLRQELAAVRRYGRPSSVMIVDIDDFKAVNDLYGHAAGDKLLIHFTRLALDTCREVDVIGRLGGDEFAVLLPDTTAAEAMTVAERLRATAASSAVQMKPNVSASFTVSIGVDSFKPHDQCIDTILSAADKLLYAAKRFGCNRVVGAEPDAP